MSQIWKKMKMKKSELNSREKNFFRRKSFSIELDKIKNVGNSLQILRGTFSGREEWFQNVNLPGGEKERYQNVNSFFHKLRNSCFKNFFS